MQKREGKLKNSRWIIWLEARLYRKGRSSLAGKEQGRGKARERGS